MAPERPYGAGGSGTDRTGRGGTGRGRAGRSRTPGPDRNRDRVAFVRPLPHSIASSALPPAVLRTPPSSSPRPGPTDSIASPAAPGPTRGLQVSGWVRAPRVMGMDGGCGVGPALQQGSLCSRYVWGGRMRAAAFGEGGPPWDVPCGVRKKPGVGRGRKGGGGSLWGCGCWRFHICSRCYLPANASGRRSVAVLVCGCSRLPALWFRGGEMLPSQPQDGGGLQPALHPFPTAAPPVPPLHPLSSPPSPRGSTHRIPTAPRAFVARWGPRAATPPPPSSPRSPRSAEAGMHAGTCVAWLSATGPPSPKWGSDGQRGVCA